MFIPCYLFFWDDITEIIAEIWRLFTDWEIPVVGLTPAYFMFAIMVAGVISYVLRKVIGMSGGIRVGGLVENERAYNRRKNNSNRKKH